jgi:NAD(P)-dependent dehydrogenase (short-subunit alcohol dehydrogenase family)
MPDQLKQKPYLLLAFVMPARVAAAGLPPIDCVISNAGIARGPVARVMSVNFSAALHLFDTFVRRGGARSIVLVASLMATLGAAGLAPYCASKWALLGLAESVRLELAREIDVVLQIVLGLGRVGHISRVRDRTFDEGARRERRVDAELEIVEIVERVEDSEDVDACGEARAPS